MSCTHFISGWFCIITGIISIQLQSRIHDSRTTDWINFNFSIIERSFLVWIQFRSDPWLNRDRTALCRILWKSIHRSTIFHPLNDCGIKNICRKLGTEHMRDFSNIQGFTKVWKTLLCRDKLWLLSQIAKDFICRQLLQFQNISPCLPRLIFTTKEWKYEVIKWSLFQNYSLRDWTESWTFTSVKYC